MRAGELRAARLSPARSLPRLFASRSGPTTENAGYASSLEARRIKRDTEEEKKMKKQYGDTLGGEGERGSRGGGEKRWRQEIRVRRADAAVTEIVPVLPLVPAIRPL